MLSVHLFGILLKNFMTVLILQIFKYLTGIRFLFFLFLWQLQCISDVAEIHTLVNQNQSAEVTLVLASAE